MNLDEQHEHPPPQERYSPQISKQEKTVNEIDGIVSLAMITSLEAVRGEGSELFNTLLVI